MEPVTMTTVSVAGFICFVVGGVFGYFLKGKLGKMADRVGKDLGPLVDKLKKELEEARDELKKLRNGE